MNIIIKETGKRDELSLIDPKSGVDWVQDLILDHEFDTDEFLYDGCCDAYVCSQYTYDWWKELILEHERMDARIQDCRNKYGHTIIDDILCNIRYNDLEELPEAVHSALDEFEMSRSIEDDED